MKPSVTNFYPANKLDNYMLYGTIIDAINSYQIINGVLHVNLNDCKTWLKKD